MTPGDDERYLVVTDHGRVVVHVRGDRNGLDSDLIDVRAATPESTAGISMETPLRAFASKMVDLVVARGAGDLEVSDTMLTLLVKEKAAEDLGRIERASKALHDA
ncbi:hypothetical protein BH23DEI1_BH23DEI1_17170 [soil metagenome]|nr:hypothetical protein [Trueperaceae bacterium]